MLHSTRTEHLLYVCIYIGREAHPVMRGTIPMDRLLIIAISAYIIRVSGPHPLTGHRHITGYTPQTEWTSQRGFLHLLGYTSEYPSTEAS